MSLPDADDAMGTVKSRLAAKDLHGGILSGEAKKALAVYGSHLDWCDLVQAWHNPVCDCGLTALLSE